MATSTVPAVKGALLSVIDAGTTVKTTWAHPGQHIGREAVFMGDAEFQDEHVTAIRPAPHRHDEEYTIPVWVDVLSEGDNVRVSEERMWTIVGEVETALRADPALGALANLQWAFVESKAPQNYMTDKGWASQCRISVKCRGRA